MLKYLFITVACTFLFGAPSLANATDDFIPAELLEKAELDEVAAQAGICAVYNSGEHIGKNDQEGFKWCTIAARRGSAESQYRLANMLLEGRGYQKDEKLAAQWMTQAAMQGYAEAQFRLGEMYLDGIGVLKDLIEAYKWLLLATENFPKGEAQTRAIIKRVETASQMTQEQINEGKRRAAEGRIPE